MRRFPKGIFKSRRPRMTNRRGRTWDRFGLIMSDGSNHTVGAHLDTTWGSYFYFQDELAQWNGGQEGCVIFVSEMIIRSTFAIVLLDFLSGGFLPSLWCDSDPPDFSLIKVIL